jgi:glucose/arabinose dehydrogenase
VAGLASQSCLKVGLAAAGAVTVLAGLALSGGDAGNRTDAQSPRLALRAVGSFDQPVYVAHAPTRPRLLFVVERPGTVRVLRRGRRAPRPFLDIRDRVRTVGTEEGLLSVAFHPRYPRNRSFFVYYVNNNGDIQVDRFRSRRGRPAQANPRSRRMVITVPHPGHSNHNGGQLQFGPGALLFMATGDGGGGGDPGGNAQNRRSLLGKLLRIRPRPKGGHRSPRTNPFVDGAGRNQIYSLGLRNPWRFSFDRRTGDIWIADVGQSSWEEINHTTRSEARGANFGWNCREGPEPFGSPAPVCARRTGFAEPTHAYRTHVGGTCAVTGGYVVRGRGGPAALRGRYVYGDFCSGLIRSLNPNAADTSATDRATGLTVNSLSSFGEGRRGALYAISLNGPVHRIISR